MTPPQLSSYLEKRLISTDEFAGRLGVTRQALYFWERQGWIPYDKQCQVEVELQGALKADWRHVPAAKRPESRKAA